MSLFERLLPQRRDNARFERALKIVRSPEFMEYQDQIARNAENGSPIVREDISWLFNAPTAKKKQFESALRMFRTERLKYGNAQEQLTQKEFVMELLRYDLQGDYLTQVFYRDDKFLSNLDTPWGSRPVKTPHWLTPKGESPNNQRELLTTERMEEMFHETLFFAKAPERVVDFATDTVFVRPYEIAKMPDAITSIARDGFDSKAQSAKGEYYRHMGFGWVWQPNHHLAVGVRAKQGNAVLREVDDSKLFPHLTTDGAYWFDTTTNESIGETTDFRLALLYTLAKECAELRTTLEV